MESVVNGEQLRTVALIVAEYLEAGREMSAAIAALHAGDDLNFDAIERRHAVAEEALMRLDPAGLRACATIKGSEDELTPADVLEEAYEQFTGVFGVRFPIVEDDRYFLVPHDAAEKFTQEMGQGIAAFRAALAEPSRRP